MHPTIIKAAALAVALALSTGAAIAADGKGPVPTESAGKPAEKAAKAKSAKQAPTLLVDINSAGKAELKKLPGIDDAQADKIVAGRPYLSKADLVTRNIILPGTYEQLKRNVVAKPK
jgi:DNA uptake protein ComE-like DNA-binding protein